MKITVFFTSALLTLMLVSAGVADDDHDDRRWGGWSQTRPDVQPVNNALYKQECGDCHFAYQPGLLPARSWQKLMQGLENHFGDNAELDTNVRNELLNYLQANAADTSAHSLSRKIDRRIRGANTPLRVSELRFFRHEHDEINLKRVNNVTSFSDCSGCHQSAEKGIYDEHDVRINGRRYDD